MKAEPKPLYPADLYHAVHVGNPGDVAFYRDACHGVDSVLELGCGNGRVAGALATTTPLVVGLDLDRAALVTAVSRGVRCLVADMRYFALSVRFERIIVPYNGLYCLLDDRDLFACLRCARTHLAPGGELIFDGYAVGDIDPQRATAPLSTAPEQVACVTLRGEIWDVYEQSSLWPSRRRVDAHYQHVARDSGTVVEASISQRYLDAGLLHADLSRAGLMLLSLNGGFAGESYTPDSEHLVVRAVRA